MGPVKTETDRRDVKKNRLPDADSRFWILSLSMT